MKPKQYILFHFSGGHFDLVLIVETLYLKIELYSTDLVTRLVPLNIESSRQQYRLLGVKLSSFVYFARLTRGLVHDSFIGRPTVSFGILVNVVYENWSTGVMFPL